MEQRWLPVTNPPKGLAERETTAMPSLVSEAGDAARFAFEEFFHGQIRNPQSLRRKWLTADYATKRRILEIVFLNCRLDDTTLFPTMRKPFDVLVEGLLVSSSRGNGI